MKKLLENQIERFEERYEDINIMPPFFSANERLEKLKSLIFSFQSEILSKVREEIEEMRPNKPYPNASNMYKSDLDDEDKIIDKIFTDLLTKLDK